MGMTPVPFFSIMSRHGWLSTKLMPLTCIEHRIAISRAKPAQPRFGVTLRRSRRAERVVPLPSPPWPWGALAICRAAAGLGSAAAACAMAGRGGWLGLGLAWGLAHVEALLLVDDELELEDVVVEVALQLLVREVDAWGGAASPAAWQP